VRITTHVRENDVTDALVFDAARDRPCAYEQGVDAAFDGTPSAAALRPVCTKASPDCGELGRTQPRLLAPLLPAAAADISLTSSRAWSSDRFYRAINKGCALAHPHRMPMR
jgi:hypothetical protein